MGPHTSDPYSGNSYCGWLLLDHPELCYICLQSLGLGSRGDCVDAGVSYLGVLNNCESVESEIMMSDILGTTWWSALVFLVGAGCGMYLRPWIMDKLGR